VGQIILDYIVNTPSARSQLGRDLSIPGGGNTGRPSTPAGWDQLATCGLALRNLEATYGGQMAVRAVMRRWVAWSELQSIEERIKAAEKDVAWCTRDRRASPRQRHEAKRALHKLHAERRVVGRRVTEIGRDRAYNRGMETLSRELYMLGAR